MTDKITRPADAEGTGRFRVADYGQVTLSKLAVASAMYDSLTAFNRSLARLDTATGGIIDLTNQAHRLSVLKWLNEWGCRNLPKRQHKRVTSPSILKWHGLCSAGLFPNAKPLWDLEDGELEATSAIYDCLMDSTGAWRVRGGSNTEVRVGPTAASKILFAIRRKALMPWDEAMRLHFECDGSGDSYTRYLKRIRKLALHIGDRCREKGFGIEDLPRTLGRPKSTVIELINEYIWVTVPRRGGRRVELPSSDGLKRWIELG